MTPPKLKRNLTANGTYLKQKTADYFKVSVETQTE